MRHIAEQKRKENISEYLLFLWQMEDLLRGFDFDLRLLEERILIGIEDPLEKSRNVKWFGDLANAMKSENVEVSGHTSETFEVLNELQLLEKMLLTMEVDASFKSLHTKLRPLVQEFRSKSDRTPKSDIEVILTVLYGVLVLRLKKKPVSAETSNAARTFSEYLAELSKYYRLMREGKLPFNN